MLTLRPSFAALGTDTWRELLANRPSALCSGRLLAPAIAEWSALRGARSRDVEVCWSSLLLFFFFARQCHWTALTYVFGATDASGVVFVFGICAGRRFSFFSRSSACRCALSLLVRFFAIPTVTGRNGRDAKKRLHPVETSLMILPL